MMTISPATARADVLVTMPDGRLLGGPIGTPIAAFLAEYYRDALPGPDDGPLCAAIIDNDLRELTFPVTRDVTVSPVTLRDSDGGRIYRRSLVFVLTTAIGELYPKAKIAVENSITFGGYYCRVVDRPAFSDGELNAIRARMTAIIADDAPIARKMMPLADAVAIFTARGDDDKIRLLEYRTKDYLTLYTLRDNIDYFYGYMLPSTGALRLFDLQPAEGDGFYLRYPRPESADRLLEIGPLPQIEQSFRQTDEWLRVMNIEDIGKLNRAIHQGRIRELILINEAFHSRRIAEIAGQIAERHRAGARLVLIAGPSSSGKTTFSKRLAVQLMAYGIQPFTLAMDNYFVNRDLTPRDAAGNYDFEALEALDRARMNSDLLKMMANDSVQLPRYDFKQGQSIPGDVVQLGPDSMIIAEGIHGLNPALLPQMAHERIFRIYVSALTALNIDRHNRIPTTDVRLLRRMIRDYTHRGYSALDTLSRWESVRAGEKRYIYPHQDNADAIFNSSLAYELAMIRPIAEPMLMQIDRDSPRYSEAKRLLAFLGWVRPVMTDGVPGDSLLREFVGGSVLEDYTPGITIDAK